MRFSSRTSTVASASTRATLRRGLCQIDSAVNIGGAALTWKANPCGEQRASRGRTQVPCEHRKNVSVMRETKQVDGLLGGPRRGPGTVGAAVDGVAGVELFEFLLRELAFRERVGRRDEGEGHESDGYESAGVHIG